jgi:hypothetical protein
MNPSQTNSLPCEEIRSADESDAAIVIPFPGEYVAAESQPETGGQQTGDCNPSPADAVTEPWNGIGEAHAQTVEREQRIRALAERWNALMRFRAQTAAREQRIRALTERWNALRQVRVQTA